MTVTVTTGPVIWHIRTTPEQREFMELFKPNSWGKFGVSLPVSILPDELLEGVRTKDYDETRWKDFAPGPFVHAGTSRQPVIAIAPDDPVEVLRLEDRWLREHALANSLNRTPRLGDVTFSISRIDLSAYRERYHVSGSWTHALGLQSARIHEVIGS